MHTHKLVNGVRVELTVEEIAEINSRPPVLEPETTPAPTKEQLLAQLQALQAQIQALE
jgi:hypothetical protein